MPRTTMTPCHIERGAAREPGRASSEPLGSAPVGPATTRGSSGEPSPKKFILLSTCSLRPGERCGQNQPPEWKSKPKSVHGRVTLQNKAFNLFVSQIENLELTRRAKTVLLGAHIGGVVDQILPRNIRFMRRGVFMQWRDQRGYMGFKFALLRMGAAAILFAFCVCAGHAQTFRGAISGTVTDPSGAVIPNAQVKATETATGLEHNTVTTTDGDFSFQDIPLGLYKVTVTAAGFPPYTVDKVEVAAGSIFALPIKLSMQQQSTTVEVSAAA